MKLYLLELGTLRYFKDRPVCGYLIRCDDGTGVLVDTGPARDGVPDPMILPRPGHGVLEQLAAVGMQPPTWTSWSAPTWTPITLPGIELIESSGHMLRPGQHPQAGRPGRARGGLDHPRARSRAVAHAGPPARVLLVSGGTPG